MDGRTSVCSGMRRQQIAGFSRSDRLRDDPPIMSAMKFFVGLWLLCAFIVTPVTCLAQIETVSTVEIASGATQQYSLLLNTGDVKTVARVWVLFTGYDGYAHVGLLDNTPVFIGRGLLIDGRGLFLREQTAVAVVDSPSTMREMPFAYRSSDAYLSGTQKVIEAIQAKLPSAKLYLVGASNGSISVMRLAARMGSRIAGVVVLSGLYGDLAQLKEIPISQPVLFVHHARDACVAPRFTPAFRDRFHPIVVEDINVHYAGTCGPYSAHHFHGQESAVIDVLYQWAESRPLPGSIR
jgi:hypothetical protein